MDKISLLISSDNCTDQTYNIGNAIIKKHSNHDIKLYLFKSRKGKTNEQNEDVELAVGEILIMTEANSIFDRYSVNEILKYFLDINIGNFSVRLKYLKKS